MSAEELHDIAAALAKARITQTPIDPPKTTYPALTADGAFEIQRITVQNAVKGGDRHVGYKLGNIAKVMQAAFGLDHPDYGFLLGSLFLHEGEKISLSKFIKPYVELEPAFVLKGPLKGPNATVADVVRAIDFAIPAIEIIDSRVKNWAIGLEDTLADNGSQGGIILGGTPRRITDLDLHNTKGVLRFNGTKIIAGNTQNILGNPLAATAWLVNSLAAYDVEFLPGQVIMPGSCLQAMPMDRPGRWSCSFEGWGSIEFDVVE
ncbi:TodF product hydratase, putative [Cordyceps militaris CM01]|uniref:TodF product hydratase, putative n=1 Tax=Cordyceps militaris (strain CM01) TaxID=983644 RepID=G3J7H7_CORMM|nr:TodF product hydratase, putative [Cordyceps militaris CM01]EGX97143.1 TodF product hydratase, putative [Cordyceps militaris CM01]